MTHDGVEGTCGRATLLGLVVANGACFSPNVGPDANGDVTSTTGGTSSGSTATTSADATTSDAESTSSATGVTTDDDTTAAPEESSSTSSATPVPFCGDGLLDDGEECDDGDANASDAACKPDCTAAICGDGDIFAGTEACDDGADANVLEVGACAPDCSRVIVEKAIVIGETPDSPDLGANPVAAADGLCDPGYLAMFAVAGLREAAILPFDASDGVDWVLQPYTAYVRPFDGEVIWITDDVPLLGVRDGESQALDVSIGGVCPGRGEFGIEGRIMTGLNADWTTSAFDTCDGWTTESSDEDMRRGLACSTTTYLYDPEWTSDCDFGTGFLDPAQVYCVEQ